MQIKELAERTGHSASTIRYYDRLACCRRHDKRCVCHLVSEKAESRV